MRCRFHDSIIKSWQKCPLLYEKPIIFLYLTVITADCKKIEAFLNCLTNSVLNKMWISTQSRMLCVAKEASMKELMTTRDVFNRIDDLVLTLDSSEIDRNKLVDKIYEILRDEFVGPGGLPNKYRAGKLTNGYKYWKKNILEAIRDFEE